MTYNDIPLHKNDNDFTLYEYKNPFGILKAYKVIGKDTGLIFEKKLRFVDPTFTVEFGTKESGDTLNRSELKNRWFSVNLYNTELSLGIPIVEANILYLDDGDLKKFKIALPKEDEIPDDLSKYIFGSSNFFILDITIKLGRIYHLPPAIFYLKD
ncbi:hypothetical protein F0919_01915 [Taibaiella lutea]|uniref:Uncharacterized protein n=1 Tax=Taibaiella lutea TaxID=2608001 RepID=A0A5M6CN66_9BACT|nr:hypothetical protein [Taibaiella lutea]KAA5536446.1 hypothetical protein F0919_01915 [Taibaiella lutea]